MREQKGDYFNVSGRLRSQAVKRSLSEVVTGIGQCRIALEQGAQPVDQAKSRRVVNAGVRPEQVEDAIRAVVVGPAQRSAVET